MENLSLKYKETLNAMRDIVSDDINFIGFLLSLSQECREEVGEVLCTNELQSKKHLCKECGKRFKRRWNRDRHEVSHKKKKTNDN